MYNYPTVVDQQPYDYYSGHSSHVSNVKWLMTEQELYLISAGGHDRSLFQWRFVLDDGTKPYPVGFDPPPKKALPAPMTRSSGPATQTQFDLPLAIGANDTFDSVKKTTFNGASTAASLPPAEGANAAPASRSALRSDSRLLQEQRIREQDAKIAEQSTLIERLEKRLLELEKQSGK